MLIKNISEQEFDNFSKNHKYGSYYQSSSYGSLMSNYSLKPIYLGFYEGAELLGATLILYKAPIMGFKYGYAPRGLLIDYENYSVVLKLIKELKSYLFKERFILLKIDPLIISTIRDKTGAILDTNEHKFNILETLKLAGFYHCGNSNNFESLKPRWMALLDLNQDENLLFKSFSKEVKNKIRKATKLGVKVYKDNTAIERIYPFIEKKGNYSLKYYQDLINCFKDKIEIYVSELDTEVFVENSKELYEKELEYNGYLSNIISHNGYKGKNMKDILNKKMNSDKLLVIYKEYLVKSITLLREHPQGLVIAGSILIKDKDTIHLLMDGYNKEYGKFCPLYLARWEIIKNYLNSEYKIFNMNAISGIFEDNNPYKNLNNLKFGYNTSAYEYLGEFNLITNSPMYALYKNLIIDDSLKNIKK